MPNVFLFLIAVFAQVENVGEAEAIQLIESHCVVCYEADVSLFEQAVAGLEKAALNPGISLESEKILADAYGQLAFGYFEEDTRERDIFAGKQLSLYTDLASRECVDPEVRYRYALALSDPSEQIAALDQVLSLQSTLFYAAWNKSKILSGLKDGKPKALSELRRAIRLATDGNKVLYKVQLVWDLIELGDEQGARQLNAEVLRISGK